VIGGLTLFIPPADATWIGRMEAACQAIERLFKVSLRKAHSGTKFNATTKAVEDREKYFRQRLKTKTRWFSLFSGRRMKLDYFMLGGKMYGDDHSYCASFVYPEESTERHEEVLVALGDALQACSSQYTPPKVQWRLRLAHWRSPFGTAPSALDQLTDKTPEESRLPQIRESLYEGLERLQPHHLGWINYWSQEVCDYIGFPERAKGTSLAAHCYRTPGGAWIVKLGERPFEERNPAHVNLLRAGYETFPRIGVRVR